MNSKSLKSISTTIAILLAALVVHATPPNMPIIDGRALEYDDADLAANFVTGVGGTGSFPWGPDNMATNLYVTWDTNYVYVALNGWIATEGVPNKVAILIDVDPTAGTGATTTTNWINIAGNPGHIVYNDVAWTGFGDATDFGADFMVASEGGSHNVVKILYNGVETPDPTNVINVVDTFAGISSPGIQIAAVLPRVNATYLLNAMEARIPWSTIYGQDTNRFGTVEPGEIVPRGAKLKLFANVHNNSPSDPYSSPIVIPEQGPNSSENGGRLVLDTYAEVMIDANDDGIPDVQVGDVNAPFIKYLAGLQGKTEVFAWFNEDIEMVTASNTANWMLEGNSVVSVSVVQSDAVILSLANPLPANGTFVRVDAMGVEDLSGNSKTTFNFLNPAVSGLESSLTVRFLLNINSGFGAAAAVPRATNFYINGGAAPLEFGYPPVQTSPLSTLNATQHYRDVTFPPGTAAKIFYKYSGPLLTTGTNNYEAIRLDNYADVSRQLDLPTNGTSFLVVTDWLGAVAAPFRDPATNTGYNALYTDIRRGDAGIRQRTTVLFQLDLSQRNVQGITRVLVQGTDPLRGFNVNGSGLGDYAGNGPVGWDIGGVTLVDNGTLGDLISGDGIYSRRWVLSTNGKDSTAEPLDPFSLVGGDFDNTAPYYGGWLDRRSPKSFKYKFYVYGPGIGALDSPGTDIDYFVDETTTNIVFAPFIWSNDSLPPPPPSNSPTMIAVRFTNNQSVVLFEGTDASHGVQIATDLVSGWLDFGTRAVTSSLPNQWQAAINPAANTEHYRAFSGPPKPVIGSWFAPTDLPATGGIVRFWYRQHGRDLAGKRNVGITGSFNSPPWGDALPMTFYGDGVWYYDMVIAETDPVLREAKARALDGQYEGGPNLFIYRGPGRATWTPNNPVKEELFTIIYDANGGPLAAATNVNAYVGFDEVWSLAGNRAMTNLLGETNKWEISFTVPTNYSLSVNFVFNNGGTWDSEGNPGNGGRQYRAFLSPPPYP